MQELRSSAKPRADAVIVVRTAKAQQGPSARFLTGLLTGLGVGGTNVVGVEDGATTPSTIPSFAKRSLSTVDDVGQPVGRLALALLLNGATPGLHYGVKDSRPPPCSRRSCRSRRLVDDPSRSSSPHGTRRT